MCHAQCPFDAYSHCTWCWFENLRPPLLPVLSVLSLQKRASPAPFSTVRAVQIPLDCPITASSILTLLTVPAKGPCERGFTDVSGALQVDVRLPCTAGGLSFDPMFAWYAHHYGRGAAQAQAQAQAQQAVEDAQADAQAAEVSASPHKLTLSGPKSARAQAHSLEVHAGFASYTG